MYHEFSLTQLWNRVFKNSYKYGLGIILMKLGALLILPLYWKRLTPEDFGTIGLSQVLSLILIPLLGMGLQESVQRFYFDWKLEDRKRHLGSIWIFTTLASLAICLLCDRLGPLIFSHFYENVPFDPYMRMFLWSLFFSNFSGYNLALFRIKEELYKYNVASIVSFLTQSAFILIFIYQYDMGVRGFFLGLLYNSILWAVIYILYSLRTFNISFRFADVIDPLRYSMYSVIAGLFEGSAFVFDRFFLDKYMNLATIGIYTLAIYIGGGYNAFNLIFKSAWIPFIYRVVSERKDGPRVLALFSTYSLSILAIPALAICLLIVDLFKIIDNPSYMSVAIYIPAIVLGYYIQSMATAMGRGLDLSKTNQAAPLVPIITLFSSFLFNMWLIPRYGVWGAAAAFGLVMLVRSFVQIFLAVKYYPRPIFWMRNLGIIGIMLVTFFIGNQVAVDSILLSVALKLIIIAIASGFLFRVSLGKELFVKLVAGMNAKLRGQNVTS